LLTNWRRRGNRLSLTIRKSKENQFYSRTAFSSNNYKRKTMRIGKGDFLYEKRGREFAHETGTVLR
jgi:hypothetical protein